MKLFESPDVLAVAGPGLTAIQERRENNSLVDSYLCLGGNASLLPDSGPEATERAARLGNSAGDLSV